MSRPSTISAQFEQFGSFLAYFVGSAWIWAILGLFCGFPHGFGPFWGDLSHGFGPFWASFGGSGHGFEAFWPISGSGPSWVIFDLIWGFKASVQAILGLFFWCSRHGFGQFRPYFKCPGHGYIFLRD